MELIVRVAMCHATKNSHTSFDAARWTCRRKGGCVSDSVACTDREWREIKGAADQSGSWTAALKSVNSETLHAIYSFYWKTEKRWSSACLIDYSRVSGWRGRLLAYSSRLELIKTCLASILIYLLLFIKFPKWVIKLIESQMVHCLWNNTSECHRYHLAAWQQVNMKSFATVYTINVSRSFI
jgi:hypothetical protein